MHNETNVSQTYYLGIRFTKNCFNWPSLVQVIVENVQSQYFIVRNRV